MMNPIGSLLLLLQKESNPGLNTVTAYGTGYIEINGTQYRHPVRFGPEGEIVHWAIEAAQQLTLTALKEVAGIKEEAKDPMAFLDGDVPTSSTDVEVVLIGTGSRQVMLSDALTSPLLRMGIGVEAMSTQAAARTYNILMSEGRKVVVAMIPMEIE